MRRLALGLALAGLLLAGCTVPTGSAPTTYSAPVDTECVAGKAFVSSYTAITSRYDPQLNQDRTQLAATVSLATARSLLRQVSSLLDASANDLAGLQPPADFADPLHAVVLADRDLAGAATVLANSAFAASDQAAFQAQATSRQAAVRTLQLQVDFITSECG
jgi:hypothetical protein